MWTRSTYALAVLVVLAASSTLSVHARALDTKAADEVRGVCTHSDWVADDTSHRWHHGRRAVQLAA
jgi:hypothetical protein